MSFPSLSPRSVRWRPVDSIGLEHLSIRPEGDGILADSVLIGDRGGTPYGVRYRVACDRGWHVLSLDVDTTDGRSLHLKSDGTGTWRNQDGASLAAFDGCIDIDLAGSPFTNTLPIRRLDLQKGAAAVELRMLYVPFDTFEPIVDEQRYRCLKDDALYRYEAVDRTFAADLPVDRDGLVLDYPTLFERIMR
jgi:uncharacterized protein